MSQSSGGVSVAFVLFLIFLVLKLAEVGAVAHWSWWWVTSPLWIPWVVVLPIVAVVDGIVAVREALEKRAALQRAMRD